MINEIVFANLIHLVAFGIGIYELSRHIRVGWGSGAKRIKECLRKKRERLHTIVKEESEETDKEFCKKKSNEWVKYEMAEDKE